jgi:hypothetical protein
VSESERKEKKKKKKIQGRQGKRTISRPGIARSKGGGDKGTGYIFACAKADGAQPFIQSQTKQKKKKI